MNSIRATAAMVLAGFASTAILWPVPSLAAGREVRNNTRTNVNRNVNSNRNTNVNVNRNVNRNVNVDVDVDRRRGYHPVATAAAVVATAAIVGSMVRTLPPACSVVVVNGVSYQNCGGTWYQPQYAGTTVQYVVINPPR